MAKPSPKHAGKPELLALGYAVARQREKLGVSQEELALLAEVDRSYMGGIERGDHNPTIMTMLRVARALHTPLHELIQAANF